MANQVVNLLHYRSLNLGEVPVNMEFGQIAINSFNGISPVEPTNYDVSLFIGTGGDDRVDEDGTDRSADVLIASVRTAEAPQVGKGWVRYQLRKARTSGDTFTGDIVASGASIRFDPGVTGSAELILPDTATNITPTSVGSTRWNQTAKRIEVWDGATWKFSDKDTQAFYQNTAPTERVNGDPLVAGDEWYDTSVPPIVPYVWDGANWVTFTTNDTHSFISDTVPVVRPDLSILQEGDIWVNSVNMEPYVWYNDGNSQQWVSMIAGNTSGLTSVIVSSVAPVLRATGLPLVQGDLWAKTPENDIYYWDGANWIPTDVDTHSILSTVAPVLRPSGALLLDGDVWQDTAVGRSYYYTAATTSWAPTNTHNFVQDTLPPGASTFEGDTWFKSDTNNFYVYSNDGTSAQWVQIF